MISGAAYRIRRACADDTDAVMSLMDEASLWLASKGLDQWQGNRDRRRTNVATDIGDGALCVIEHGVSIVATITVNEIADADFYRTEDDVKCGLYVHRMAVTRREAGQSLGSAMLDWAGSRAVACGRTALRLDAWVTNGALHAYYKNLGFEHIRTEEHEARGSGALFERPAATRLGFGPAVVDGQP